MKNRLLVLLCGLLSTLSGMAQQRTLSQAQALASQYSSTLSPVGGNILGIELGRRNQLLGSTRRMPSFVNTDRQPFYVFNDEVRGGFVIVAGDQHMGDILGYSTTAPFDVTQMPDGMVELLTFYAEAYNRARQTYAPASNGSRRAIQWQAVSPMTTTKWGQRSPYNAQCPQINGQRALVGCGAIAMAQVMKYHKYPSRGSGSFSYVTSTAGVADSFNFGGNTFSWNTMQDSYSSGASAPAVAKLAHACGVSIGMDYGLTWSNSSMVDIPYALINYFNYSESANTYLRDFFTQEQWEMVIMNELQGKRPIIYRGADQDYNNGHLFVIDGCDAKGLLHVNWGWFGNCDGFFELDNLVPTSNEDYRFGHFMIKGISPEGSGELEDVFFADQFTASLEGENIIGQMKNVWCYANCTNQLDESNTFEGYLGMALYDQMGELLSALYVEQVNLRCLYGWYTFNMDCGLSDIHVQDGVYLICPTVFSMSNDYFRATPIRTFNGATNQVYYIQKNGEVRLQTDVPTGISVTKANPSKSHDIYTLDGRTLSVPLKRGVYIRNGKKIVKK